MLDRRLYIIDLKRESRPELQANSLAAGRVAYADPELSSVNTAFSVPTLDHEQEISLKFKSTLRHVADADSAYWDYSSIKSNSNPQAYFQYPAMMVPRMQGDIVDAIQRVFPDVRRTFDP